MSLFIETIKIENGELQHLDLHLKRMQDTCYQYFGSKKDLHSLRQDFCSAVKDKTSTHKLSIYYDLASHHFSTKPYSIKPIDKLYFIEDNVIEYRLKYANRNQFNQYSTQAGFDNDMIIIQNKRFTDATYANLAFWNGQEWHTPLYPLLPGTKRQHLLQCKLIIEKDILLSDLKKYKKVSLINAMLELGESCVPVSNILAFLSD